jgi:hypothetical protein
MSCPFLKEREVEKKISGVVCCEYIKRLRAQQTSACTANLREATNSLGLFLKKRKKEKIPVPFTSWPERPGHI